MRSIIHVLDRLPAFVHLKSEISNLKSLAESISRQLAAWARSLQECDIEGPRRLTDAKKEAYGQKKRAEAFIQKLSQDHQKRLEDLQKDRTPQSPQA